MLSAMDKPSQQDYIRWRGPELAGCGLFRNWFEVACQLRREGAYCAHAEMHPFRREQLNRICDAARAVHQETNDDAQRSEG